MGIGARRTTRVLAELIGTPCELGAPVGSGQVDCYSMLGEYLSGTRGIILPPGVGGVAASCAAYREQPEEIMDTIAHTLRDHGCEQIIPYYHVCGDILQLVARRQFCRAPEDRISHWGIDAGNANVIVAAMRHTAHPRVRVVPLGSASIVRAYRPPRYRPV